MELARAGFAERGAGLFESAEHGLQVADFALAVGEAIQERLDLPALLDGVQEILARLAGGRQVFTDAGRLRFNVAGGLGSLGLVHRPNFTEHVRFQEMFS